MELNAMAIQILVGFIGILLAVIGFFGSRVMRVVDEMSKSLARINEHIARYEEREHRIDKELDSMKIEILRARDRLHEANNVIQGISFRLSVLEKKNGILRGEDK